RHHSLLFGASEFPCGKAEVGNGAQKRTHEPSDLVILNQAAAVTACPPDLEAGPPVRLDHAKREAIVFGKLKRRLRLERLKIIQFLIDEREGLTYREIQR